jgi:hypothetical protein
MNRHQLADYIENLAKRSPESWQQLCDIAHYLGERATADGVLPEGAITNLIQRQTPEVRYALYGIQEVMQTPRDAPFANKLSESDWAHRLGLDPQATVNVLAALDGMDVLGGLAVRMKPDYELPPKPATLRDHLTQAANEREPLSRLEREVENWTRDAATGLGLRETLETVGDETARQLGQDYTPASTEEAEPHSLRDQLNFAVETHERTDWHGHEA